jgi:D-alanine-D-alanine ligase-like ATP-grasp enzyme
MLLFLAQSLVFVGSNLPSIFRSNRFNWAKKIIDIIAQKVHIITWHNDIKPNSERTSVIVESAKKAGIEIQQQQILGSPDDTLRFKKNGIWHEFYSLPTSPNDDKAFRSKLDSKWHTKRILDSLKAPNPKGYLVCTRKQLLASLQDLTYPVVIKPAQGSRGRHSHIFVNSTSEALESYKSAKKICFFVMCEEMLHGSVYRFTTINGKLAAVLRGDYPQVLGDDKKSIAELITIKNNLRPASIESVEITSGLISLLHRQNLKLSSIPTKKEPVILGQKIGIRYGGDAVEVTGKVHESFKQELEKIAGHIPLFVLGFDVILDDITKPTSKQNWGIIEINTIPFINLHHYPRVGIPVNVADKIWREVLKIN